MVIILSNGKILKTCGVHDVLRKGVDAFQAWVKGEKLAPETVDEYQWFYVTCAVCNMTPIVSQCYHCRTCGYYCLCSACEKKGHEHSLHRFEQPTYDGGS